MESQQKKTDMNTARAIQRKWHVIDADGKVLGRLATRVATILQGKHRPTYIPHMDTGDYVVVVNAEKIHLTGKKRENKTYRHHTGYVGHLVEKTVGEMLEKEPEEVTRLAIRRMLPKTKLGRVMFNKLKVYRGPDHPHAAQSPEPMEVQ